MTLWQRLGVLGFMIAFFLMAMGLTEQCIAPQSHATPGFVGGAVAMFGCSVIVMLVEDHKREKS